jgi:protein TonB
MLISKFDLYKTEWLDLVFDDRNKEYGAYYLRQHYAGNMVRAMGIAFFSIGVLCGASIILSSEKPIIHITHYDGNHPLILPPVTPPVKKIDPPAHIKTPKPLPVTQVLTTKVVPPVVVPDHDAEKPVINDQIKGAVGQATLEGKGGANVELPVDNTTSGTGTTPAPDESVHPTFGLDVMPTPVGGDAAWAKFLNKNLRFPAAAQEDGISGKVFLSFIIEKDGHLSNITVDRPAGHGFDEEALRVLKLAKAWKPGMQNGQAVRVKYSIPINFQLSE